MKPNSNKRSRGRNNRRNNNNRSQVFDSNGPDVRIRGTAYQVNEKYMALAKDAASGGDLILAESYLQHAEHYQRIINSWNKEEEEQNKIRASQKAAAEEKEATKETDDLSLPQSILTPAPVEETTLQDA